MLPHHMSLNDCLEELSHVSSRTPPMNLTTLRSLVSLSRQEGVMHRISHSAFCEFLKTQSQEDLRLYLTWTERWDNDLTLAELLDDCWIKSAKETSRIGYGYFKGRRFQSLYNEQQVYCDQCLTISLRQRIGPELGRFTYWLMQQSPPVKHRYSTEITDASEL